jgi:hypothetical protein
MVFIRLQRHDGNRFPKQKISRAEYKSPVIQNPVRLTIDGTKIPTD